MAGLHATVFGSSGLTGKIVLDLLLADSRFDKVLVFNRNPCAKSHLKLDEIVTGFEPGGVWEDRVKGDCVFCCLGTTIAKAGSKEAFRKVDFDLPVRISHAASRNGVGSMLVMSSLGADARSGNFYLRTKGEMEETVRRSGIRHIHIFRPSMLLGTRTESRPGETMGKIAMKALAFLFSGPLRKYRAIHAETVAKAMIRVATEPAYPAVLESDLISAIGK